MNEKQLKEDINKLRELLREKEIALRNLRSKEQIVQQCGLSNEEIARYSRHVLMPEINVKGQVKIKNSSVLIVGAGGLGCPSALYLAGAGIGHIGIVDYDNVEINNLHRQLLYNEEDIGLPKVHAAAATLDRLNNNVKVTPYKIQLDSSNALEIIKLYDVILDATDNVATRYLLNDACVLSGKPLVSGAALRFEGQLSVYNHNGPCYRCIFPTPSPPETVTNCNDGGVLGAAVGTIGLLQALEALKIVLNMPGILSGRMLLFDGIETTFRTITLRHKDPKCAVCGNNPTIHRLVDYEQFCGSKANDKNPKLKLLEEDERVTVKEYYKIVNTEVKPHVLIDVRSFEEFEMCRLKDAINIPMSEINKEDSLKLIKSEINKRQMEHEVVEVYVLCRRGNDSQRAVKVLQNSFDDTTLKIKDIIGGVHAWGHTIDHTFPIY